MPEVLHTVLRTIHILLGMGGFVLGALAIFLPKFGRTSRWHRFVGRGYAVCMLGMGLLSVPLSLRQGNWLLLVIGLLTLLWVAGGWQALRGFLRARAAHQPGRANALLRRHIIWMGSSYIAAWTAFLVNVQPIGGGQVMFILVYIVAPSVIGTLAINRAVGGQVRESGRRLSGRL